MADLTDRIAQVISRHHGTYCGDDFDDWYTCRCDLDRERFDVEDYDRHLAAAIVAELELRRASRPNDYGHVDYPPGYQYVTKWIADD